MNPVFAVDFMNRTEEEKKEPPTAMFKKNRFWIAVVLGLLLDIVGQTFLGNLLLFLVVLNIFNRFILTTLSIIFRIAFYRPS
jgi:hypothetical protein